MIDSIIVPSSIHLTIGVLVLLSNSLVLVISGWLTLKKRPLNRLAHGAFILFQLALMLQTLIGIKLLDQGLGILQLYIHYLGGLAPLFFCLLFYWLSPAQDSTRQTRRLFIVTVLSLAFAMLTFTVGRSYVAGGSGDSQQEIDAPSTALSTSNLEQGESLYTTCAGCHGAVGEGVAGLGVALQDNEFIQAQSDDELVAYIIEGRAANAPDNRSGLAMPAWGGNPSLNEDQLYNIVAFLRVLDGNNLLSE